MTGVDRLTALIRDVVAPALRELGFRGSGQRFVLPDPERWLVVGVQRNRWNDASSLRFTVNLTAVGKQVWSEARVAATWLPAEPAANATYPIGRTTRVGALLPNPHDLWWELTPGVDGAAIAAEVVDAIRTVGLPWLRGQAGVGEATRTPPADQTS